MNQFNITPGTIFYSSWGYEQTNVSFYQVVRLSGKASVVIREIFKTTCTKDNTDFYGHVMPNKNQFIGDEMRKRINTALSVPSIKLADCERAYLWDNKPKYVSSYA